MSTDYENLPDHSTDTVKKTLYNKLLADYKKLDKEKKAIEQERDEYKKRISELLVQAGESGEEQ